MTLAERFTPAFQDFMSNRKRVEEAILKSTRAGFAGGSYKLELFEDGTFRVLWSGHVGNRYASPGIMLTIPELDCEEYEADDESASFFESVICYLEEIFADAITPQG